VIGESDCMDPMQGISTASSHHGRRPRSTSRSTSLTSCPFFPTRSGIRNGRGAAGVVTASTPELVGDDRGFAVFPLSMQLLSALSAARTRPYLVELDGAHAAATQ